VSKARLPSSVQRLPERQQADILQIVRTLATEHPDLNGEALCHEVLHVLAARATDRETRDWKTWKDLHEDLLRSNKGLVTLCTSIIAEVGKERS
jgi:hypothetical protein